MIARIQIPKGWRRLRAGEKLRKGDRMFSHIGWEWLAFANISETASPVFHSDRIIRRAQRPKKWAPRGWREVSHADWNHSRHESHKDCWRYSEIGTRKLLTWGDWYEAGSLIPESRTRFWLRRGAK
jgi:hypothetical protein